MVARVDGVATELGEAFLGPQGDGAEERAAPPDFEMQLGEPSVAQIISYEVLRHMTPSEPARDESVLGREIDDAPRASREDPMSLLVTVLPMLTKHDLKGLREDRLPDRAHLPGEHMRRRGDGDEPHVRAGAALTTGEIDIRTTNPHRHQL